MARPKGLFGPGEGERPDVFRFERLFWSKGLTLVAGVDEVGRGCLAGPVVACAVILPVDCIIPGVDDSKALSPVEREGLARQIKEKAVSWAIGVVGPGDIDQLNILRASLKAMKMAVEALDPPPHALLVDGNQPFKSAVPLKAIPKGDVLSHTISAASIVAKVYRDALMVEYHSQYPQYNFAQHKGYPTKGHKEALSRYGPCPIHRMSFKGVRGGKEG